MSVNKSLKTRQVASPMAQANMAQANSALIE